MKLALIGSRPEPRDFDRSGSGLGLRRDAINAYVRTLPPDTVIVSGGAEGADSWAFSAAKDAGLICIVVHPAWKRADGSTDRGAGIKRNAVIVELADRVVAFFGSRESAGTANSVATARREGKAVEEWRFDAEGRYGRMTE